MLCTIEIIDDAMCVMDEDGNTHDGIELAGYRDAKRQIQKWAAIFTINVADASRKLAEHFAHR